MIPQTEPAPIERHILENHSDFGLTFAPEIVKYEGYVKYTLSVIGKTRKFMSSHGTSESAKNYFRNEFVKKGSPGCKWVKK